jgi:hypothetical protein
MKIPHFAKITAFVLFITLNPAKASLFFGGGVGATDGLILEAGYKANPFVSLRARGTYLPSISMPSLLASGFQANSGTFTNIDTLKFESKTYDIGAEITPIPLFPILSSIKLIGAVQYMDTQVTLGSGNYNAVVSNKNAFAPYFGLGIDIISLPIVSLRTTFGGSFRSFEVQSTNGSDSDKSALSSKIDSNIFVPSASLTIRATLPNVPFIPFI